MNDEPRMSAKDFAASADDATIRYFRKQLNDILSLSRQAVSSEQISQISAALAKAQPDFGTPTKRRTATVYSKRTNKTFTYKYADLEDVMKCVRKPLADNELAIVHMTQEFAGQVELVTRLVHSSGEYFQSIYPVKAEADRPQEMGSAMTYARRYTVSALLGIASEEDDDAQGAQEGARSAGRDSAQKQAINELAARREAPKAATGPDLSIMSPETGEIEWSRTNASLGDVREFMRQLETACQHSALYWAANGAQARSLAVKRPNVTVDDEQLSPMVERLEGMYGGQVVDDLENPEADLAKVVIP